MDEALVVIAIVMSCNGADFSLKNSCARIVTLISLWGYGWRKKKYEISVVLRILRGVFREGHAKIDLGGRTLWPPKTRLSGQG